LLLLLPSRKYQQQQSYSALNYAKTKKFLKNVTKLVLLVAAGKPANRCFLPFFFFFCDLVLLQFTANKHTQDEQKKWKDIHARHAGEKKNCIK